MWSVGFSFCVWVRGGCSEFLCDLGLRLFAGLTSSVKTSTVKLVSLIINATLCGFSFLEDLYLSDLSPYKAKTYRLLKKWGKKAFQHPNLLFYISNCLYLSYFRKEWKCRQTDSHWSFPSGLIDPFQPYWITKKNLYYSSFFNYKNHLKTVNKIISFLTLRYVKWKIFYFLPIPWKSIQSCTQIFFF